jgi:phosphotransferase family enzyme
VDWRDPVWLDEAHAWIRAALPGTPTGSIEQPQVYPWATVLRVPSPDGLLWFKANAPVQRFEAALTAELARAAPDITVELVAVDVRRGWMLMRDAGSRLRELIGGPDQLDHWLAILPRYAELQRDLAALAERFIALGVPDERLGGLARHLEEVLDDDDLIFSGRPGGITPDEHARLRDSVSTVSTMCSDLAAMGVPETVQHDDFHDGQIFVRDGRYRFLDWGDACISHPFHTLVVTLRVLAWQQGLAPGGPELLRLRDAYLEPFEDVASPKDLRLAFALAHRTGTIGRALAWSRYFVGDPDAERDDTVAYGLKMFLSDGPIGSVEPSEAVVEGA